MSVIVHISVPPRDFKLEQTVRAHSRLRIDVERVIPFGEAIAPYLCLSGIPVDRAESALRRDDDVARVDVLERAPETALVHVEWGDRSCALFDTLVARDATCLGAVGEHDAWHLDLRFPSRGSLTTFYEECVDHGVSLTINRICDQWAVDDPAVSTLSELQYETLRVALDAGYFSVPRGITLQELADRLGVSDTAASQRIRRGLRKLVAGELETAADPPNEPVGNRW